MPCAACERRRQAMKEMIRKAQAHATRLLALRGGKDAKASITAAKSSERPRKDSAAKGQAGKAGTEHEQRRVEAAAAGSDGAGRDDVPDVRANPVPEGRGTRRSQGRQRRKQ